MQKRFFVTILFIIAIFSMVAMNTNLIADEGEKAEEKNITDDAVITALVKNYKDYVAKSDAENLLKILSSDSVELLETELNKLKKVMEVLPKADLDKKISSLGKTPREILAMNVQEFLEWALSRLTDWDKEDLEKAELESIVIAEDGKSATLQWSKSNINEAPEKAVKEDNKWKIVVSIS